MQDQSPRVKSPVTQEPERGFIQFSTRAQTRTDEIANDYENELRSAAKKVAKRCHADSVSAAHVNIASSQLSLLSTKKSALPGALGGILLGAALENVLSIVSTRGPVTHAMLAVTFLVGTLGACCLTIGIKKQ